jgi:alkylation response protein AidB-like acyl-CoA dehydrogenase
VRRVHHAAIAERFLVVGAGIVLDVAATCAELGPARERTGLRGTDPRSVTFDNSRIEAAIGGRDAARAVRRLRRLADASIAVGVGRRAVDEASAYVRASTQFGVVLADLPVIRAMLAEMRLEVDGAQSGVADAVGSWRMDDADAAAVRACSAAVQVALHAIQLHGGYGYISEYPVERLLRDAVSLRASLGGTRSLRLSVAPV